MPPSTRRQAASRSQRYSEVSAGGLSDDLAAHDEDVTQDELDEQEVDAAEFEEPFEEIPGM